MKKRLHKHWLLTAVLAASVATIGCSDGDGSSSSSSSGGGPDEAVETFENDLSSLSSDLQDEVETLRDGDDAVLTDERITALVEGNPDAGNTAALVGCVVSLGEGDPDGAKAFAAEGDGGAESYCVIGAETQQFFVDLGELISFVLGLLAPGHVPAQAISVDALRPLLDPAVATANRLLDAGYDLAAQGGAEITIDSLPINLDAAGILEAVGGFENVPEIDLNLAGRYDGADLRAIPTLFGAIASLFDFVFAHQLSLEGLPDFSNISTAGFTGLLAGSDAVNNNLKLTSDGDTTVSGPVRDNVLQMLGLLVGDSDISSSLLDEIEDELANNGGGTANDFIRFIPSTDGSTQAALDDQIRFKLVDDLAEQIGDIDGDGEPDLVADDAVITNPLQRSTYVGLIDLGAALINSINAGGGDVVSLGSFLSSEISNGAADLLWQDLQREIPELAGFEIEDWIGLDLGAYFSDPVGIRNFLPAITTFGDGDLDFAFECELGFTADEYANPTSDALAADSIWRILCGTGEGSTEMFGKHVFFTDSDPAVSGENGDFRHFNFNVNAPVSDPTALANPVDSAIELAFDARMAPLDEAAAMDLASDGLRPVTDPSAFNDGLLSIILVDPSLNGQLHLDLEGNGNFTPATNQLLNDGIAFFSSTFVADIVDAVSEETGVDVQ